jgi:uncharacterized protein (DUF952 family)
MIYHMTLASAWQAVAGAAIYVADSLATEGFIHCTGEPALLVAVANRFYRTIEGDFVILCIEPTQLQAELRWEAADGHLFPHLYGGLNCDAVCVVVPFPRDAAGNFLPPQLPV